MAIYIDPWHQWNVTNTSSATTNTWYVWTTSSNTTSTSITMHNVWSDWQNQPYTYQYVPPARQLRKCEHGVEYEIASKTTCHECQVAMLRKAKLRAQLERSRRRREELAHLRALELLMQHLDRQQAEEFERSKAFHAVCPRTGRRFKIRNQWSGNLDEYDEEGVKITKRHCVHHERMTAVEDNMLTQKLMIEAGLAEELCAIANTSRVF